MGFSPCHLNLLQIAAGAYTRICADRQVDFIVPTRGRKPMLVQVCESLADPRTRRRETSALNEAMVELGVDSRTLVTRNEDGWLDEVGGTIEVVPAWRLLIEIEESTE